MNNIESTQNNKTSPAVFFLAGMFFLIMGLLFLPGTIRNYKFNRTYEHKLPTHIFQEYPTIFGNVDDSINSYLIYANRETKIRIYFEKRNSIKGWWRGSNASMQIYTPFNKTLSATTNLEDKWGFLILSKDVDDFIPWLDVIIFVDPEYYHTWVKASVSMDIVYPDSDGTNFSNHEEYLSQEVQFFVTSDNDVEMQKARKSWGYEMSWLDHWTLPFLYFLPALVLFVIGIFTSFRSHRLT